MIALFTLKKKKKTNTILMGGEKEYLNFVDFKDK